MTTTTDLAAEYARVLAEPSDIQGHLSTFVEVVADMGATQVLELGTRTGVSTIAWLHALDGIGHLTSVDLDAKPDIGDYDHWTFVQGSDLDPDVIDRLPRNVDIVFLDTSHLYEHTVQELRIYQHLIRPGGIMMCHDTELPQPEGAPPTPRFPVKTAIEEYAAQEHREWINVPHSWGLGIIRF